MGVRLWKHKNQTFYAVWEVPDGRTKRISLKTKDRDAALVRMNSFSPPAESSPAPGDGAPRLSDFFSDFLSHAEATLSYGSFACYRTAFNRALEKWGREIRLSDISPGHIDDLIVWLIRSGVSVPTLNKYLRHLKSAFRHAHERGLLVHQLRFPRPLREMTDIRYLTKEEMTRLFSVIDDAEFHDFCHLSACTGLRSGELIRLRKSDIDNPAGFIRVSSQQKNRTESRIPIGTKAREILCRVLSQSGDRLFRFGSVSLVSHKFKAYARKAGLEKIRFHDLRHTFASHHAMSGTDIYTLQKLMRHRSLVSTLIYAKLSPDYLRTKNDCIDYGIYSLIP
ncbi:MAG: tyrosine-type recombinase/integrase [Desulfococcaceae bacterium]